MMLTEEQRQALGEALTTRLAAMCPNDTAPDWFDSCHVDEVLDVIEATLANVECPRCGWAGTEAECIPHGDACPKCGKAVAPRGVPATPKPEGENHG